ncbi:unnamed protein product [Clonostachys rosea]|uniref:Nucleoside phosphorylase domain-containing protein n=1 Tax=Bionectria ochroleuca TaxID=29856 RepID=A0ABY6UFA3_BIOOC|nr:unnamed protein product [Clonostachys rosea]
MASQSRAHRREHIEIAIICALPLEYDAITLAFDELGGETKDNAAGDYNKYRTGLIGGHHAVLLLLPGMGKVSAASATANLRSSYSGVRLAILTGICGGVPRPGTDDEILLGDVVISKSVIQYDLGRQYPGRFATKNTIEESLGRPSKQIRSLVATFETRQGREELQSRTAQILAQIQLKAAEAGDFDSYKRPATKEDRLFEPDYLHRHDNSHQCECSEYSACDIALSEPCEVLRCGDEHLLPRRRLQDQDLQNHQGITPKVRVVVGRIGSGDTVIKSGVDRDNLASAHDLVAFEMEGAGVWDEIPCIVIKSVCDYADSHKSKKWQPFASVTAASATKALLEHNIETQVPSRTWFMVPYNENPDFVQRPGVFDQIKQLFQHGQQSEQQSGPPRSRVALYGLGGIGKTQIVLAYAFWLRREHPDVSIFWVHASNTQRFRQAYSTIAQECGFPGHDDLQVDILDLVKTQLERWSHGRWMMIIDNADDPQLFFPSLPNGSSQPMTKPQLGLGRYLPECARGSILITSRNKQVASKMVRGKQLIKVAAMGEHEVNQLIHAMLDDEISTDEISQLSARLEHLPLALAQATAFIQENSISIPEYLQILDQNDDSLLDQLSEPFEAVGRDSETPHAVTATWAISFLQIQQQDALAGDILSFASLLDRHAIPEKLIVEFCNRSKTDQHISMAQTTKALGTLKGFSFISQAGNHTISMHRLVQLITRKWLKNSGDLPQYVEHALDTVCSIFPSTKAGHVNKGLGMGYVPHATAILQHEGTRSFDENTARGTLLHRLARFFYCCGRWDQTEQYANQSMNLRKEILGPEHIETLNSMNTLALAYSEQGRCEEAEKMHEHLAETQKRIFGEQDPGTLTTLNNLAKAYSAHGLFQKAEELQLRTLETTIKVLGEDNHEHLTSMNNLAISYCRQGKWKEAEDLQLHVLDHLKRLLGDEHPRTMTCAANLASNYALQGQLEKAKELLERVLETEKRVLGDDHPSTLTSMNNLAMTWKRLGQLGNAVSLLQTCLHRLEERLGEEHPSTKKVSLRLLKCQRELKEGP